MDTNIQALLPYEMDLFDDNEGYQTQFRKLFSCVKDLGGFTTVCFERIIKEQDVFNDKIDRAEKQGTQMEETPTTILSNPGLKNKIQKLYNEWVKHFVTHLESMREIKHYVLSEKHFGLDEKGKRKKFKSTNGSHVFLELTRLNYLLHYPQLLEEMDNLSMLGKEEVSETFYLMLHTLKMTKDDSFISIVDSFDITSLLEEKEDPDEQVEHLRKQINMLWTKPIMEYTQSEVEILILFLTQQINDIKTKGGHGVEEYRKVFTILWLRVGKFFMEFHSEQILDDPKMRHGPHDTGDPADKLTCAPNQRFIGFCFFYMGELIRRFFHYDLLYKNQIPLLPNNLAKMTERTKAWLKRITESLADDAFDDIYQNNMPIAYAFVGDDGWFKFSESAVHSRGACIAKFRPHLHKRFFSEAQVTPQSVLSTTKDAYVSRLFVLRSVNEHLKIEIPRLRFMNAAVIMNADIEQSAFTLQSNKIPVFLQVFSSFWVYDRGRVYVCDDIYEAVALWFWLLHTKYNNHLYDCDLTNFVEKIVISDEEEGTNINLNPKALDFDKFEF